MIKELIKLNKKLIDSSKNNKKELKKQLLIKKILKDNKCFFKLEIEVAYQILKDLGIKDSDIKDTYSKLIDISNY